MRPLSIEEIIPNTQTPVDLYIQLPDGKYILIVKAGDTFEPQRLQNYQIKNVQFIYVQDEDYQSFIHRTIQVAGLELQPNAPQNIRSQPSGFSKKMTEVMNHIESYGLTKETFLASKEVSKTVTKLVDSNIELTNLIMGLSAISDQLLRESLAVGFLAPMIGIAQGWERQETLEKLSLGGILHDIGQRELPKDLIEKARAHMSFEEVRLYETHPFRGMQILTELQIVPDDIVAIVYEHHENAIGQGFPRRLWNQKINPLARVVGLANTFCELTFPAGAKKVRAPSEAIQYIETVMGQPFHKDAFLALKKLIQSK